MRPSAMNPGGVRVFLNPVLAQSLAVSAETHPTGAAAVREIYAPDLSTRLGWSASLKTTEGWFWYEEFHRHGRATVARRDAPGCTGCHASGRDSIHTAQAAIGGVPQRVR